jgi:uncharacterized protein with NRDE domain
VCTLILAWQVFEDAPVVVAANRDEADGRPSSPPAVRDGDPRFVAPRDEEAGGTWFGYNEAGVFVGITNRWVGERKNERSRGLLVRDALGHRTAEDAARSVERAVEDHDYSAFHLVLADANAALLLAWEGRLSVHNLDPGVHVVVNVGADGRYFVPEDRPEVGVQQAEDADRVRAELQPEPGESALAWHERAASVLGDHEFGRCIHGEGYGTQSASLLRLGPEGAVYEFADGKPCETESEPVPGFTGGGPAESG